MTLWGAVVVICFVVVGLGGLICVVDFDCIPIGVFGMICFCVFWL